MNLIERLADLLGMETNGTRVLAEFQIALEQIRRAKRTGQYDDALAVIDEAAPLADKAGGDSARLTLELHRAHVFTLARRWDDAARLLDELETRTGGSDKKAVASYVFSLRGVLAQARGEWEEARIHCERALRLARESGHAGAEGRAQGHLADTYLQEDNASFASYLLQEALPKLTTSGDVEMIGYFTGQLGESLIALGKTEHGTEYLGRALRLAEQTEARADEIRWRRALAIQAMHIGQYAEARRHFMLVLAGTDRESGAADYALTLCQLSKSCLRLGEVEAALDYARQALDIVHESDSGDLTGFARAAAGIALRYSGDAGGAVEHLEAAALDYEHRAITPADYTFIDVLRNLAAAQAERGDHDIAADTYARALKAGESAEAALEIAGTRRDIGILRARQGRFDAAIEEWTAALRFYEEAGQPARVARLHCDIANIRKRIGQGRRALRDYERALMLLSSVDDVETRGVVLANAATAYVDRGDIETAESFFVEAIKIAGDTHDRTAEATRRGNYGWFLLMTGRAQRALSILGYALQQSQNLGLALQTAVQTDNLGLAHDMLSDYAAAEDHHRRALDMLRELGDAHWEGMASANLAHTLLSRDDAHTIDEAETLLARAEEIGRQSADAEVLVCTLNGRARLALKRDDTASARAALDESIRLGEENDFRRLRADALLLRAEIRAGNDELDRARTDWHAAAELFNLLRTPLTTRPDWLTGE